MSSLDLSGTDLRKADFEHGHYAGSCLDLAQLAGARFQSACFKDASLALTRLQDADLSQANFEGAKFFSAQLQKATLAGGYFDGADFLAAHLTFADLRGASFRRAALNCVLFGARAEEKTIWPEGFDRDQLEKAGVIFTEDDMDLSEADERFIEEAKFFGFNPYDLEVLRDMGLINDESTEVNDEQESNTTDPD